MRKVRARKILLNESGYFLSRKRGCFVVRSISTKEEVAKYPILERELGEIQIISGNLISTGALVSACFNRIPVVVKTALGSPVGILKSLDDFSHVETRCFQYESYKTAQALTIAEQIVLAKIKGQNEVLKKYGLRRIDYSVLKKIDEEYDEAVTEFEDFPDKPRKDALDKLRGKLRQLEGSASMQYFRQLFSLFPESFRPEKRYGFKAYDGLNNTFNLGYRILFFKVMTALIVAKLEPYLGYYHTLKDGQPSLVCDFMEIYRYLIDDFLINFCRNLDVEDFVWKDETFARRKGKRAFLNKERNKEFLYRLEDYFQTIVNIPRVKIGKKQKIETLINEEALLLARFIRRERLWEPRIASLPEIVIRKKTRKHKPLPSLF
jgi:CRISPR-associated protein Cas1